MTGWHRMRVLTRKNCVRHVAVAALRTFPYVVIRVQLLYVRVRACAAPLSPQGLSVEPAAPAFATTFTKPPTVVFLS